MTLFPMEARKRFNTITGDRYDAMKARMERKKLPPLPFTRDQFRAWALEQLAGQYDGAIQCRYCNTIITIEEASVDHAEPLSRGGSTHLCNLNLICDTDNDQKGSMLPYEYIALLEFLEREIPLARTNVLRRLAMANKLAAGQSWNKKKSRRERGKVNESNRIPQA